MGDGREEHDDARPKIQGDDDRREEAAVRVPADRFDPRDAKVSAIMADQPEGSPKATEWNAFRTRLFDEPGI